MEDIIFFILIFLSVAVIVAVAVAAVRKNNRSIREAQLPVTKVRAKVTDRRVALRDRNLVTALVIASDTVEYDFDFETKEGEHLTFRLIGRVCREILDGDEGQLSYQGKTFISFERDR